MPRLAIALGAVLVDRHRQVEAGGAHQPIARSHDLARGLRMRLALLGCEQALERVRLCHNRLSHRNERRFAFSSEEHTSALQSLMRISYAVFCLNNKISTYKKTKNTTN